MALIACSECGKQVSDKATACPSCGCPVAASLSYQPISALETPKSHPGGLGHSCPRCQSDYTQAVSALVAQGTTAGSFQFADINTEGALAVGGGVTASQSQLAQKFDCGPRPVEGGPGLVIVIIALAALAILAMSYAGVAGFLFVGFPCLVGILVGIIAASRASQRLPEWERRKAYLDSAWVCLRCGTDFLPS